MKNSPFVFLTAWLSTCLVAFGAGTWNGAAITAWNGIAITAWNGTGISVGGGGGGATATDTFDRTNASPMSLTASDGVSTWVSSPGVSADCDIISNELFRTGSTYGMAMISSPTFAANQSAEVTIGSVVTGGAAAVRIQSASNASCYYLRTSSTTAIRIYRLDDTGTLAATLLGASITTATLVTGDVIKLTVNGTTLEAFLNGVSQGTRTDSTYSAGQPGVVMLSTGAISAFQADDL